MPRSTLGLGLAAVFAGMAAIMVLLASVYRTPVPLLVAAPFGVTAALMWTHGTGRSIGWFAVPFGGTDRRGDDPRRPSAAFGRRRRRPPTPESPVALSRDAAYRRLGLTPGADQEAIRAAYRNLAKETHPDGADGDSRRFRRVSEAYDRLRE